MLDRKVLVSGVQNLGAANYLLTLRAPEQARLVKPGQFLMLKCGDDVDGHPLLRRPFSIFQIDYESRTKKPVGLKILIKDVGFGTHKLALIKPGQEVFALGPQGGHFALKSNMGKSVRYACLVAGGVGIAAVYLLAKELLAIGVTPVLFYGARRAKELVLRESFEKLKIKTFYTTLDGSKGIQGLVTAPLVEFIQNHRQEGIHLYACGPWAMMRAVDQIAADYSVLCEVSLEARMGCSVGACMGCVVRTRDEAEVPYIRVCLEGPVVSSRRIDWDHPPL